MDEKETELSPVKIVMVKFSVCWHHQKEHVLTQISKPKH